MVLGLGHQDGVMVGVEGRMTLPFRNEVSLEPPTPNIKISRPNSSVLILPP